MPPTMVNIFFRGLLGIHNCFLEWIPESKYYDEITCTFSNFWNALPNCFLKRIFLADEECSPLSQCKSKLWDATRVTIPCPRSCWLSDVDSLPDILALRLSNYTSNFPGSPAGRQDPVGLLSLHNAQARIVSQMVDIPRYMWKYIWESTSYWLCSSGKFYLAPDFP